MQVLENWLAALIGEASGELLCSKSGNVPHCHCRSGGD
jgi:hypothetical protein